MLEYSSHMQAQGLSVTGVHAMLSHGCMSVMVWVEVFRINFYTHECYKVKGFISLFLRLVVF